LAKWGPRIPFVGKILAGSVAASIILNPETSDKEKGEALGGLIGGLLGAGKMATVGFGLGAAVGAPGGPLAIASSIAGGVIGAGAGWMGGEWAGRKLMGFLMSGDSPEQDAEDLEPAVIKANRLESLNKEIAKEKGALPQIVPTGGKALTMYNKRIDRITEMEKERDSLMSEFESLDLALNSPKIAYDTPGKMHQYMAEYKQAVTSTGKKWTDSMNQDAYNYAVNQVSADQNTNNNINYYDGSMGVHQRDMPTNILNSELQHAAGWAYS